VYDDGQRCEFTERKRTTSASMPAALPSSLQNDWGLSPFGLEDGKGEIRKRERWDGCRPPHSDGWPPMFQNKRKGTAQKDPKDKAVAISELARLGSGQAPFCVSSACTTYPSIRPPPPPSPLSTTQSAPPPHDTLGSIWMGKSIAHNPNIHFSISFRFF
jgi:hypothetical protein